MQEETSALSGLQECDEEEYVLSEWGCLYITLTDYGINVDHISGRVGQHIVEDFMEAMTKAGYVRSADGGD